jgi:hypothetical protein
MMPHSPSFRPSLEVSRVWPCVGAREGSVWGNQACPPRQMTPRTPPIRFPVSVLHRQRKTKYDEQIVLNFSPASPSALQVGV